MPDDSFGHPELIIFTDASEVAYGACAYARWAHCGGAFISRLIMAKNRIAPKQRLTVPRLELSAAVTGVRLYRNTIHEIDLPVESTFFWTDSTLTYQYITNTKHRFKTYPANRVTEILEDSTADQWRVVPGDINPADILTRGVHDPADLINQTRKEHHGSTVQPFCPKTKKNGLRLMEVFSAMTTQKSKPSPS